MRTKRLSPGLLLAGMLGIAICACGGSGGKNGGTGGGSVTSSGGGTSATGGMPGGGSGGTSAPSGGAMSGGSQCRGRGRRGSQRRQYRWRGRCSRRQRRLDVGGGRRGSRRRQYRWQGRCHWHRRQRHRRLDVDGRQRGSQRRQYRWRGRCHWHRRQRQRRLDVDGRQRGSQRRQYRRRGRCHWHRRLDVGGRHRGNLHGYLHQVQGHGYQRIREWAARRDRRNEFRPRDQRRHHFPTRRLGGSEKYPIFVWGEGACSLNGLSNATAMAEIASHGYFVVADGTPNGTGSRPMDTVEPARHGRAAARVHRLGHRRERASPAARTTRVSTRRRSLPTAFRAAA